MAVSQQPAILDDEATYCAIHPDRETALRCNKCDRLMCTECAVQTPVGYRCKQCIRAHEDKFFNATMIDYLIVGAVGLAGGFLGTLIIPRLWFILVFFIAIPYGGFVGDIGLRLTRRRRGRQSAYVATGAFVIAALSPLAYFLLLYGVLVPNISLLLYAGLAGAAVYGRYQLKI